MPFPSGPDALDAAWIEAALRAGAFPNARVRAVSLEVVGAGYGLTGTAARVTIDGEDAPETLVAKWAAAKDARAERRFYEEVAQRLRLDLARLYASAVPENGEIGVLLLEDVAPATQGDVLAGATRAQAEALVDAMAVVHSAFWDVSDDPVVASLPAWFENVDRDVASTRELLPRFIELWGTRLSKKEIQLARAVPDRLVAARNALEQAPRTLVHADLHLDNVLFRPDGRPVILDWASARRGPGVADFARLLVENMTPDARRAGQETLAARYSDALQARGVVGYRPEHVERDVAHAFVLMFGAAVRVAGGPEALRPGHPRVLRIVESLVRRAAAAAVDGA